MVTFTMTDGSVFYLDYTVGQFKTLVNAANVQGAAVQAAFTDTALTAKTYVNLANVVSFGEYTGA